MIYLEPRTTRASIGGLNSRLPVIEVSASPFESTTSSARTNDTDWVGRCEWVVISKSDQLSSARSRWTAPKPLTLPDTLTAKMSDGGSGDVLSIEYVPSTTSGMGSSM